MGRATLAVLLLVAPLASADEEVPVSVGVTVLLKVLTYDSGFEGRGSGDFVVLLPHSADQRDRIEAAVTELQPVARAKLKARSISFVAVKAAELAAAVDAKKASAILLLPGADEALLAETSRLGRAARVYTLALGEDGVKRSAGLGVTVNNSKPQVVVNVAQSRAEGVELPQSILKVAKLIR